MTSSDQIILLFAYGSLGLVIFALELIRKRVVIYDYLLLFNVSFLLYFVAAPIHLLLGGEQFSAFPPLINIHFLHADSASRAFQALTIWVAWLCVILGYLVGFRLPGRLIVRIRPSGSMSLPVMGLLMALVGAAALVGYGSQYGDIWYAIKAGAIIRAGAVSSGSEVLFLKKFILLPQIGFLILIVSYLTLGSRRLRTLMIFLAAVLLPLCVAGLLADGSRRGWIIFALSVFLLVANQRGKHFAAPLLFMILAAGIWLVVGDLVAISLAGDQGGIVTGISAMMAKGGETLPVLYAALWKDFSLPFTEAVVIIDRFSETPRAFADILLTIPEMIPERILAVPLPERLADHSTFLITGIPTPLIAEVPPGFIGFFWYSGYLPGVIVGGLFYGALGGAAARVLRPEATLDSGIRMLLFVLVGFLWAYFVRVGVPYMIVGAQFHWIIAIVAILAFARLQIYDAGAERGRTNGP